LSDHIASTGDLPCPPRDTVAYHWVSRTQEIVLFWIDGEVRACSAVCPHMGARLEIDTRRRVITCPWHGLTARIGPPDVEGFPCSHARYRRIKQYRITQDDRGHIVIER
jgi:nitrite reductase/ring-hydroxylating ferredoxin subunit